MSVEDIVRSIGDLAYYYELTYHGCSQCTLKALQDSLNIGDDLSFKAATALAAGIAMKGIGKSSLKPTIRMGAPK